MIRCDQPNYRRIRLIKDATSNAEKRTSQIKIYTEKAKKDAGI